MRMTVTQKDQADQIDEQAERARRQQLVDLLDRLGLDETLHRVNHNVKAERDQKHGVGEGPEHFGAHPTVCVFGCV